MFRIFLFMMTNLAVVLVAGVILNVFGLSRFSGGQISMPGLLVWCFIVGMAGSLISLFISKWIAKRSTGLQLITEPQTEEQRWLVMTVQELAGRAGIRMPEVGIFPSLQSNAFATGWNKNDALVAVSSGLLQRMSRAEVRAVLGHEIGHVANGDMVTLSLVQGVVNTFVMFFARIVGYAIDRSMQGGSGEEYRPGMGFFIGTMVAELVFGILASMIVMWFSRFREFRADEAGARLADKQSMIGALKRLQAEHGLPDQMPAEMTALAITEGKRNNFSLAHLFMSHPPLEKRIAALEMKQL